MRKLIGEGYIRGLKCIGKVLFPNSISGYVVVSSVFFFSSVQSSVLSDSLQPHGLPHARPSCPSSTRRVYSDSYPLSQ